MGTPLPLLALLGTFLESLWLDPTLLCKLGDPKGVLPP